MDTLRNILRSPASKETDTGGGTNGYDTLKPSNYLVRCSHALRQIREEEQMDTDRTCSNKHIVMLGKSCHYSVCGGGETIRMHTHAQRERERERERERLSLVTD